MKASTLIFVAALVLLLGSLTAFNLALRTEYRTGSYKNPLASYNALAFRNFDVVDVPAASAMNVKIVAGPFGVHLSKRAAEYVRITQQGQRLTVALAYPKEREYLGPGDAVLISCPSLQALTTDGVYTVAGKTVTEKAETRQLVVVQGFAQDSLRVRQDHASRVQLTGNTLGFLRAVAGLTPGSGPTLDVSKDNRIQAADLLIGHHSQLNMATAIPRLRQQFSDSAVVIISGAAARSLGTPGAR